MLHDWTTALRRTARAAAALICLTLPLPALAQSAPPGQCTGRNLIDALPPAELAALRARVDAAPFSRGNLWQAEKGDARMVIAGTYHFGDPRHDATITRLTPDIDRAGALMVEAGPQEEKQLTDAMTGNPDLLVVRDGPTLPERLPPEEWKRLAAAMNDRGIPAVMASKMQPWYVSLMLGMSPCMIAGEAASQGHDGLDYRLMDAAAAAGTPVHGLEPWDTVFTLFADLTPEEELEMIRVSLPQAEAADDYGTTLIEAYFKGDSWLVWEFLRDDAYRTSGLPRAEVDEMLAPAQSQLIDNRNRSWIAPLTKAATDAAAEGKPIVAGFGALHLPGANGVLNLLAQDGWTVTPLPDLRPPARTGTEEPT